MIQNCWSSWNSNISWFKIEISNHHFEFRKMFLFLLIYWNFHEFWIKNNIKKTKKLDSLFLFSKNKSAQNHIQPRKSKILRKTCFHRYFPLIKLRKFRKNWKKKLRSKAKSTLHSNHQFKHWCILFVPDLAWMCSFRCRLTKFPRHSPVDVDEFVMISILNCWLCWGDVTVPCRFPRWNEKYVWNWQ